MIPLDRILVFQTAFPGDVVLTLPLVQTLRALYPRAHIAYVAIPVASDVLRNHPAVDEVIPYDKRGRDRGLVGILSLARALRDHRFDVAFIPHRSLRSAAIVWLAKIPRRIGFSSSTGRRLMTDIIRYDRHAREIARNLSLLDPLAAPGERDVVPTLHPGPDDRAQVDAFLREGGSATAASRREAMIAVAPGSVWNTKRWLAERYAELATMLLQRGFSVVLIGGSEDRMLCSEIAQTAGSPHVLNAAGKLSLLQSAELIRRCRVAVSNDSAPMHLATAVGTPVVAIFGATVPEFGFAPRGQFDEVVEIHGLSCRPCSIHGGRSCPIKTFDCMKNISANDVAGRVTKVISRLEGTH